MNILMVCLAYPQIGGGNLYSDLADELSKRGHKVFVVCPHERRYRGKTTLSQEGGLHVLRVLCPNLTKTGVFEKAYGTLVLERLLGRALRRYLPNIRYGLIVSSTPPITVDRLLKSLKRKHGAPVYLLLKDIFPQNAVDIGMMKSGGLSWRYFIAREKSLYRLSDYIGCMSPANVRYLLANNQDCASERRVEVCPNSIKVTPRLSGQECISMRSQLEVPVDAVVVVYGGNLGRPQGVHFLADVVKRNRDREALFFLIVGSGTEYDTLNDALIRTQANNWRLLQHVSRESYQDMLESCDIGLILLDKRFTIPNFPSRLLSYLQASLPIIAATDTATDIGSILESWGAGVWCQHEDIDAFQHHLDRLVNDKELRLTMGLSARNLLECEYIVERSADIILRHFSEEKDEYVRGVK